MNKPTISAIIPCYNEGEYVVSLVKTLVDSKIFHEIILVDDGSKPKYSRIYDQIMNIKIIHKKTNEGKDYAIKTGIENSSTDYIGIIDADLQNLTINHLKKIGEIFYNYDILYLIRGADIPIAKFLGTTYITVGEHIIKRDLIEKYKEVLFSKEEWSFDNEINKIVINNKKELNIKYLELKRVTHLLKSEKYSLLKGLILDLKMILKVLFVKYKFFEYFKIYAQLSKYIRSREVIQS